MRCALLDEVWNGLAMAIRRGPAMLAIAGMIAVACLVLSLTLGVVLLEVQGLRGARQLMDRQAVAFTPYGYPGSMASFGDGTVQLLVAMIDRREAYTAVLNNMGVDDPLFPGGHAAMVLFGDAVSDLFPELDPPEPESLPFALLGAQFTAQNLDALHLGGVNIPAVKTLPAGTTFFDPGWGVLSLDHRLVIRASAQMLPLLGPTALREALGRAVMFDPAYEVVDAYVSGSRDGELYLAPFRADVRHLRFRRSLETYAMYSAAMLAFLAIVLFAFASSARLTLRQELPNFKIREMYGATAVHLTLRIASFLGAVVLVLPGVLLFLLGLMRGPYTAAALWVALVIGATFVCLLFMALRQVCVQDGVMRGV
jgi:hypothetical protein